MSGKYDRLKLDNQLCFPLYACSKEVVRRYKPYLDKIGLTYTQYITMMDEEDERNLIVRVTKKGLALRDDAVDIPLKMGACLNIDAEEAQTLYRILHKLMSDF